MRIFGLQGESEPAWEDLDIFLQWRNPLSRRTSELSNANESWVPLRGPIIEIYFFGKYQVSFDSPTNIMKIFLKI